MSRLLVATLLVLAVACVSVEDIAQHEDGPAPTYDQARDGVAAWVHKSLKDPESARVESSYAPAKGWYREFGERGVYAWRVDVSLNAKNSYGGYVGFESWAFYFQDGTVTYASKVTDHTR